MLPNFLSDIQIETASVPKILNGATARGVLWQAAAGRFLLDVPGVARYLVEDGKQISIEPIPQADKTEVDFFLQMTPLASLLFQRGTLAFHAAVAATRHGAVLLAGDSGAGKSTLLASLHKRGWRMLADDLTVVDLDEDGSPIVFPICPNILLWPDAMKKMEITAGSNHDYCYDNGRQSLFIQTGFSSDPEILRAVYWLSVHNKNEIEIKELTGTERFIAWGALLYNSHIADALLDRAVYFQKASAISDTTPLRRLIRPRGQWSVDDLADILVSEWQ